MEYVPDMEGRREIKYLLLTNRPGNRAAATASIILIHSVAMESYNSSSGKGTVVQMGIGNHCTYYPLRIAMDTTDQNVTISDMCASY